MRGADLTVQVSTKLNRSHVVPGRTAVIWPTLGRTEKDHTGGRSQRVTVEVSMSAVHASQGPREPASAHLRSEVDIVCSLAEALLEGRHDLPWGEFRADYTEIRRRIARVVPGCAAYDEKVDQPGGFVHPDDIEALGLHVDQVVDLVSEWTDGSERRAEDFRIISYDQPRGCAAAYFPETNPLVPLDSSAIGSNCPTSKSIIVRLDTRTDRPAGSEGNGGGAGQGEGHKSGVEPDQLS